MGPTPPSLSAASSSGGAHSPDTEFRVVRKRNRVPLSCGPCRHRKLKCNRSHPCENCIKRGDSSSCTYATPGSRKKSTVGNASPDGMQDRIDRLEGLILSLMTNGAQSAGPAAANGAIERSLSDTPSVTALDTDPDESMVPRTEDDEDSELEEVADTLGMLKVDLEKGKSMYVGDTHWHTVLKDVQEVKSYFSTHLKEFEKKYETVRSRAAPRFTDHGSVLLLGSHEQAADVEIRAELPPKSTVDRLVTRFLNDDQHAIAILHAPTFHRQLLRHWQDPASSSLAWIGLLYAVLCLAMRSYHRAGDEPLEWKVRSGEMTREYRLKAVQCLVNSDYTKPTTDTMHTLIFYMNTEYGSRFDADSGMGVMASMVVRLAMRMGYHRDPARFSNLTPFEGEMRRRLWTFVRMLDMFISFNLGLPSTVKAADCDTELPTNIHDHEFDPETKELPPSRPCEEPTQVTFLIAQGRLMLEFSQVLEFQSAVRDRPVGYDEVMKFDNRLQDLKARTPPSLRIRPLDECLHDSAATILQRFRLETFWLKAMCVLHRKYLVKAHHNPKYAHSRRACVESAMTLLRYHQILHHEAQGGGRLHSLKQFLDNCTQNYYLHGAVILCLDLHYEGIAQTAEQKPPHYDPYFWTPEQRVDMLHTIEMSQGIWISMAEHSMEAFKASSVIALVLDSLKRKKSGQAAAAAAPPTHDRSSSSSFAVENLKPEESAAMTLGMLSGGGMTPRSEALLNSVAFYQNVDMGVGGQPSSSASATTMSPEYSMDPGFATMPLSMFAEQNNSNLMDPSSNLDWDAWDAYVQNGNNIDSGTVDYLSPHTSQPAMLKTERSPVMETSFFSNSVFMGAGPGPEKP